jgi:hypothetical protein
VCRLITQFKMNAHWLVAGPLIVIIILSVLSSNLSIRYILGTLSIEPQTQVYDEKLIPAVTKMASLIPKNETMVASASSGIITFFTDIPVKTPQVSSNITSQELLVEWMSKHNFNYLVVTRTNSPTLKELFNKEGLEENFREILGFKTEFDEIHLYKRIV